MIPLALFSIAASIVWVGFKIRKFSDNYAKAQALLHPSKISIK